MADQKLTDLTAQTTVDPDDLLYAVDVSDTSMAASGTSKKATRELLQTYAAGTLTTDKKLLDLSATWNDAGVTFTGIKLNATDTASNAASLLMDLQTGGTSRFNIGKTGIVSAFQYKVPNTTALVIGSLGGAFNTFTFINGATTFAYLGYYNSNGNLSLLGTNAYVGFGTSINNPDVLLVRDAADTLAQRRTTNAQTFRLYNTFTDASNYERGFLDWQSTANEFQIGTESAGTGTARIFKIRTNATIIFQAGGTIGKIIAGAFERNSSNYAINWGTTTNAQTGITSDLGLARSAAGKLVITNGSTGAGSLVFRDDGNIEAGTTTGTKIGTGTTQKLAFWDATPIVQPINSVAIDTLLVDTGLRASGGTANFASAVTAPNLANGRTLQKFTPLDNQPPASNFATLDTRNSVAVLDFDDAADESAVFVGYISQAATLTSGIKVRISWAATSATSGDCVWAAQFEKTTGHDIDSDSFDTATTGTTTTSGTSGVVNTTEITCTTIDSLAAGDSFRLKIYRDADAGGDTMTGDAELVAVELQQVA